MAIASSRRLLESPGALKRRSGTLRVVPVAILIADHGDARDAVGLFLAGRGWTTLPVDPDPDAVRGAVDGLEPGLVAIDFRGRTDAARACLDRLTGAAPPVYLFNAPEGIPSDGMRVIRAAGPDDIPAAPGRPAPPHPT
jgi:hypothetical protein